VSREWEETEVKLAAMRAALALGDEVRERRRGAVA
jgi:hypothetical protein